MLSALPISGHLSASDEVSSWQALDAALEIWSGLRPTASADGPFDMAMRQVWTSRPAGIANSSPAATEEAGAAMEAFATFDATSDPASLSPHCASVVRWLLGALLRPRCCEFVAAVEVDAAVRRALAGLQDRRFSDSWRDLSAGVVVSPSALIGAGRAHLTRDDEHGLVAASCSALRAWDGLAARGFAHVPSVGFELEVDDVVELVSATLALQRVFDRLWTTRHAHWASCLLLERLARRIRVAEAAHLHRALDCGLADDLGAMLRNGAALVACRELSDGARFTTRTVRIPARPDL